MPLRVVQMRPIFSISVAKTYEALPMVMVVCSVVTSTEVVATRTMYDVGAGPLRSLTPTTVGVGHRA